MATRKIETTIALDGEQQFKQALSAATREMRVMESELKAVSAAYDVNGNSADYFAAKQQNLRGQISQQRQIIEALEQAVKDAAEAYGESSRQVDGYAIRLNNARTRMAQLEKQLEATDREVEELGRDSIRAGRQIEDGIGEGAENAERSMKDLISTMQEDIGSIRTSSAVSAVTGLWDMASGAFSAVGGFVDSTQEYRRQLSFLEQNAEAHGYDFSALKEELYSLTALTGDSSSAIEGLSTLLALDPNERQMTKAIENLSGAVVSFPETMKFESLAESLQETIATGSATGQFAELLGRLGVDVDEFNKALEDSDSAAGDLDIALSYLAANGMEKMHEKWEQDNQDMIDRMRTQAELQDELATFSKTLEKYIVGPTEAVALQAMKYINEVVALAESKGLEVAGKKVGEDMLGAAEELGGLMKQQLENIGDTINPINVAAEIFEGFGNEKAAEAARDLGETFNDALKKTMDITGLSGIEEAGKVWGILSPQGSGVNENGKGGAGRRLGVPYPREYTELTPLVKEMEAGEKIIKTLGVGEEWKKQLDAITTGAQEAAPTVQAAGESVGDALSTGFEEATEEIETTGEEAGESAGKAFEQGAASFSEVARRIGVQIGASFAVGIESQYGRAYSAAGRLGAGASAGLSSGGARHSVVSGIQTAAQGNVTAILNIDGKSFARVTAPYLSSQLARHQ